MNAKRLRAIATLTTASMLFLTQVTAAPVSQSRDETLGSLGRPTWYNEAFHQLVVASGTNGTPLPAEAGWSASLFPGIRPGSWVVSPNWCTLNFIFSPDGSLGGSAYVGTARHCVRRQLGVGEFDPADSGMGRSVSVVITTRVGETPRVVEIGTVIDISRGMAVGNDFALIKVKDELRHLISPSVAGVGGPSGVHLGRTIEPAFSFGHGAGIGTGGTSRAGAIVAHSSRVPSGFGAVLTASPGDSGSPVVTQRGAAVGVMTHIGANVDFLGGTAFGTRLDSILSPGWLQNGTKIALVSCTSVVPWTGLGCPP